VETDEHGDPVLHAAIENSAEHWFAAHTLDVGVNALAAPCWHSGVGVWHGVGVGGGVGVGVAVGVCVWVGVVAGTDDWSASDCVARPSSRSLDLFGTLPYRTAATF
jgi:hypothetical protein